MGPLDPGLYGLTTAKTHLNTHEGAAADGQSEWHYLFSSVCWRGEPLPPLHSTIPSIFVSVLTSGKQEAREEVRTPPLECMLKNFKRRISGDS
jgi:hypothetical protein